MIQFRLVCKGCCHPWARHLHTERQEPPVEFRGSAPLVVQVLDQPVIKAQAITQPLGQGLTSPRSLASSKVNVREFIAHLGHHCEEPVAGLLVQPDQQELSGRVAVQVHHVAPKAVVEHDHEDREWPLRLSSCFRSGLENLTRARSANLSASS